MGINRYIAKQFANPEGLGGSLISFIMNRQNRPMYEETIRRLAPSDADSLLDIGCGNGYVLRLLANRSGASLAGIDPAGEILASARRRNRKLVEAGRMRFDCGDVRAMAFPDEAFSKAYTINTVYFWDDLGQAMREIRRVLRPGGVFINTLYTNEALARFSHTRFGYARYDARQLTDAGREAGFSVEAYPFPGGAAVCYVYRKEATSGR